MKKVLFASVLLLPNVVLAQQLPSPNEQALGNKLMQEIQGSLTCSASVISLQAELTKAQARVKELEASKEQK
jgi:hypothetical protein